MPFSLYDATVPAFRQQLGAVLGLLDKAEAYCREKSIPESEIIGARLIEDMFPFSYQVMSTATHSIGAIAALAKGVFSPELTPPPTSFNALRDKVAGADKALAALTPGDVNPYEGADMAFQFKEFRLPFTAENFLLSFSMPNFYFHATTAYDILRHKGIAVGKRDFTGQLRIRT